MIHTDENLYHVLDSVETPLLQELRCGVLASQNVCFNTWGIINEGRVETGCLLTAAYLQTETGRATLAGRFSDGDIGFYVRSYYYEECGVSDIIEAYDRWAQNTHPRRRLAHRKLDISPLLTKAQKAALIADIEAILLKRHEDLPSPLPVFGKCDTLATEPEHVAI